jgi:hypothetical protein
MKQGVGQELRSFQLVRLGFGGALLLVALSCVSMPRLGPPPQIGPPAPVGLTSTAAPDAGAPADTTLLSSEADSAAAELNRVMRLRGQNGPPPEMVTPVPVAPSDTSRSAPGPATDPGTAPTGTSAEPGALTPPDPTGDGEAPSVSVDLPVLDRTKLKNTALSDMAEADSLVRSAALRVLPARERDKLETALGLTRQARDAATRGDLQAAANLAYKAKLLAAEVAVRSR